MKKQFLLLGTFVLLLSILFPFFHTQAQNQQPPPILRLQRGIFDAAAGKSGATMGPLEAAPGPYSIIQFRSPPTRADLSALLGTGVTVHEYLPEYAYLVSGAPGALDAATALPGVYARTAFTLADKLSPGLLKALAEGKNTLGPMKIIPWEGRQVQAREALSGLAFDPGGLLTPEQLIHIARLEAVRWLEPVHRSILLNDYARNIMAVNTAWESADLYGEGQIIGVTDTGLDTGNTGTMSPDFAGRIAATYVLTTTGNWADEHGHGTHVAGSAAGAGVLSGAITVTHSYTGSFAGAAPEAQLAIQAFEALGDGTIVGLPADYYTLFDQMYGSGARLHSNSWGDVTGLPGDPDEFGGYVYQTQRTDEFIWDHPDLAVFFAAGNSGRDGVPGALGFCLGDGVIDPDSLLSPGTAKNVITVAASESDKNMGPYQDVPWLLLSLCFWTEPIVSDTIADNPDGMAAFSSRGPVDDGRIKPDITAPGVNIVSNRSQVPGATELWGAYDANYSYSGGTSMATPLTAGAGALVREWLGTQGEGNPSAALVKATMLNTTHDMAPGQYGLGATQEITFTLPNAVEGWGRVDLGFLAKPAPYTLWFHDHTAGLNPGESVSYTDAPGQPLQVITDTQPLRFMLVWTDPPASLTAGTQLVNDLDLVVTGPGGVTYYGNDQVGGDRLNNVEGVVVEAPLLGAYQVSVTAFNIPIDAQPYALVVAGPLDDGTGGPPTSTPTPTFTPTATIPPTGTPLPTATSTSTATFTPTFTGTPTSTATPVTPPSPTETHTPTSTGTTVLPPAETHTPTSSPTLTGTLPAPTPIPTWRLYLAIVRR
jgi:subtilisin family serine protease